jgi:glycosyltransferase involved in cell wall biosynthesis
LTLLAFAEVVRECPDARLTMIGDGPLWEACKQMARAMGIAEAVEFPGPRPPADVAKVLRGARAFVQHSLRPTHGDSEGTPVAVLEAGAAGLPVVATRHGGIVDVVVEDATGFLVDEGDVAGMARHMARLAAEPALAGAIGAKAREHISAHFSLEKTIDRLWRILTGRELS